MSVELAAAIDMTHAGDATSNTAAVELWAYQLPLGDAAVHAALALLMPHVDEGAAAAIVRKLRPVDKLRTAAGSVMLRCLAARLLAVPPAAVVVRRGVTGKPVAALNPIADDSPCQAQVDVTLSHHGEFVVAAGKRCSGGAGGTLGVDIVSLQPAPFADQSALDSLRPYYADEEWCEVMKHEVFAARARAALLLWTAKEAAAKVSPPPPPATGTPAARPSHGTSQTLGCASRPRVHGLSSRSIT
jgi:phosphopantetheinyl transferase